MLLAPVAVAALHAAQAALFAPPPGQPLRVVTQRVDGGDEGRRGHRIERLVRFARDGEGWRAEVLLVRAEAAAPSMQNLLDAGYGGLAGRKLVFRLDAGGRVTAIDDREAHWQAFCGGVKAMVATRRGDTPPAVLAALAERLAAPLCGLAPERQHAALASLVLPLIAEEAAEPPGERAIRLPGTSPFGGPVTLEGTRRIVADGLLVRSTTRAAARVTAADGAAGMVEVETERTLDPLTGLLANGSETVRTTAGARATQRVTTVQVRLEPASAWP